MILLESILTNVVLSHILNMSLQILLIVFHNFNHPFSQIFCVWLVCRLSLHLLEHIFVEHFYKPLADHAPEFKC